MPFVTLSQAVAAGLFKNIRFVATDMDGTLTWQGKFTPKLLQALENLAAAGIPVLIVTGRSAGWVSGLSSLMPVAGAIAENGGLFYRAGCDVPVALTLIPDLAEHRHRLAQVFNSLKLRFPRIQESVDNRFRITDWTFDVAGLTPADLQQIAGLCRQMGWGFTYSSVQCHIKPLEQDKAAAVLQVLQNDFPQYLPAQVVTVGDSPNDASLFDCATFPHSVGVANVLEYVSQLTYLPAYITAGVEAEGFCELAHFLLSN